MVREEAPRIRLGSAQWGAPYGIANRTGPPDDASLRAMLAVAGSRGVDALDTARAYGSAEARLGRLAGDGGFDLQTKVTPDLPVASGSHAVGEATRKSVEESLAATRREVLDAVLLHRGAHLRACRGAAWRALRELRESGRIRRIGVSATSPDEAEAALAAPGVDVVQVAANAVDRRLAQRGFFARARERGVRVQVRSAFLQGALLMDPARLPVHLAPLAPALRALRACARGRGVPLPAVLLAAVFRLGADEIVIGVETREQLEESLDLLPVAAALADAAGSPAAPSFPEPPPLPDAVLDPWRWPRESPG